MYKVHYQLGLFIWKSSLLGVNFQWSNGKRLLSDLGLSPLCADIICMVFSRFHQL